MTYEAQPVSISAPVTHLARFSGIPDTSLDKTEGPGFTLERGGQGSVWKGGPYSTDIPG